MGKARYRKGAHTVYDIKYHLVWATKYRYQVLQGEIARRARDIIRDICMQHDVIILKGHISRDHVHLLVSAPPRLSVSEFSCNSLSTVGQLSQASPWLSPSEFA